MNIKSVHSNVKDKTLVQKRRAQLINGAMILFKEKGFHRTTTREIANSSGFSIGTLYEYIRSKEDVLYLVYEAINDHVHKSLEQLTNKKAPSVNNLLYIIDAYYRLMDEMQDEVTILYQEFKSLDKEKSKLVLQKERKMVELLADYVMASVTNTLSHSEAELFVNNIFVQGHMWGFRRWMLSKNYSIDEYIEMQINFTKRVLEIEHVKH